jgi:hypothetical protein
LRRVLGVVARIGRSLRNAMAVLISALLLARVLGSILWIVCSVPVARRVAVWRFGRRLRRSGLDREAADTLVEDYAAGISLFGRRPPRETSALE